MQDNRQDQQESRQQQQPEEQPEREGPANVPPVSVQAEQLLTAEQQKAEECMDMLRRTQADFVNYRRRANQEQTEGRIVAQSALLSHLLPVLDDLGRALGAAPPELSTHPWVQGLFLVARRLTTQLDQLGVRQIGTPGEQFDPHLHEAIMTEVRPDTPEGTILRVVQPGYALGERVVRPAQVSVAGTSSSTNDESGRQAASEL
jgi:molecular chaperone GrpE